MLKTMPSTPKPPNGAADPAKPKRAPSTKLKGPSADDVARRAYEIYQSRGGDHGADFDDWLEAERQLKTTTAKTKKRAPGGDLGPRS